MSSGQREIDGNRRSGWASMGRGIFVYEKGDAWGESWNHSLARGSTNQSG